MHLRFKDTPVRPASAFSLLEVMIAMGIFFLAIFSILAVVSQGLRNAKALEQPQVDAGMVASLYVNTNRFNEGSISGDFGDWLEDFKWDVNTYEYRSNGLLRAEVFLHKRGLQKPADAIEILVFDPNFRSTPTMPGPRPR